MLEQIYNKLKDKFFNKFKKPYIPPILAHFPISLFFKKKTPSVTHNFTCVSKIMPKFRKTNDLIPRKHVALLRTISCQYLEKTSFFLKATPG